MLVGLIWLFQIGLLDVFYRQIRLGGLKRESAGFASALEDSDLTERWETGSKFLILHSDGIGKLMNALELQGDLRVELWSEAQSYVFTGGIWEGQASSQYTFSQKLSYAQAAVEKGGAVYDFTTSESAASGHKREYALCAHVIPARNGDYILMLVDTNLTPVGAAKNALMIQLMIISAFMMIIAAAMAFVIAERVSNPIRQLVSGARDLGRGQYDASFKADDYSEIAELSGELAKTAAELGKTDKLRRELIANVSHDLRTPLTLITGYAEMIRDLPDENTQENMQVIIGETRRLTSLVTGLLDISQLEADTVRWNMQEFNITKETEGVIVRFAEFCKEEGFTIRFAQSGQAWVKADLSRIMQTVYNYITNAINHTGEDKLILVKQYIGKKTVTITVTDTGMGISPQQEPFIWDRYYKASGNHKRNEMGSGLGLSIVKNIMRRHPGASFGVHPGETGGSTFWFSLPLLGEDHSSP